jgi:hypothetical protein
MLASKHGGDGDGEDDDDDDDDDTLGMDGIVKRGTRGERWRVRQRRDETEGGWTPKPDKAGLDWAEWVVPVVVAMCLSSCPPSCVCVCNNTLSYFHLCTMLLVVVRCLLFWLAVIKNNEVTGALGRVPFPF